MRNKKLLTVVGIIVTIILGISIVYASPSLTIKGEGSGGNKIKISWDNPYGDAKNYPYGYRLYKSTDGGSTYNTISMWAENDEVKVLNIYPITPNVTFHYKDGTSASLPKSASMKAWMEGGTMIENGVSTSFENYGRDIASGRQLIKVDPVSYSAYNANPDGYLKDSNGNYKYDVIAFGTWDANNWYDLNQNSANATVQYIKSGRGAFFGHDTLYQETSPVAFAALSPYVNVSALPVGTVQYNGEINSDTGRGGNVGGLSKIKIVNKSSLTSYPWNIGDVGTVLTIPSAHNLQSANGKILMRFDHRSYSASDHNNPENFFLTLNNNTAMSQTGHSSGASTEDERKIIANSLFYLKQINSVEHASDNDVIDQVAPSSMDASIVGCATSDDYKKTIKLQAQDRGTSYKYYVEGMPQTQGHGINMRSNTISQEYTSGVDSFWYTINDSPTATTKPNADNANWKKATNNSYTFTSEVLNNTKPQYVHYFSKDQSGNVSNEAIYTIPTNHAPVISIQPKTVYEHQYTTTQWQKDIRNKGLLATDIEDGIITNNIQLISDTTNLDKPGTYKVTYKVKDNGCVTTVKENIITVKYNNPPIVKAVDRTFYEGQYTAEYWYDTLQMKGITATDVEDGSLTKKVHVVSDNVSVNNAGSYTVKYEVTDAYNKTGVATSKVTVKYNNPPVIKVENQSFYEDEITMKDWKKLREEIVSASDTEDGNITDRIEIIRDNINPTIPDTYQIVYKVIDDFGKSETKTVDVQIKYNTPPLITGVNKRFMESELTKEEWLKERIEGIEATDVEDDNLTSEIKIVSDDVQLDKAGFYHVKYKVFDTYGKYSEKTIEVEIVYNHLPLIMAENKTYYENELTEEEWIENEIMKDISAIDAEDGVLTNSITYEHNVDVTQAGIYEVKYTVSDRGGKETSKTIDVMIKPNHQPVLDIFAENKRFIEGEYTLEEWINEIRMENVSASDIEDNDLTDVIEILEDNVDPSKNGVYEVTYKVTDKYGKSKETTIKVTVETNLPPVIHASDRWFTTTDKITEKELLKKVLAFDDIDGEMTNKVTIKTNEIEEGVVGEYKVIYAVTDRLGKEGIGEAIIHITELDPIPLPPVDPPTPPSDASAVVFANGKKYGLVTLDKVMEHSETLNGTDYESVVFGVYANEDMYWKENLILRKDSLVGLIQLDGTQHGSAKVYHAGNYYVREVSVNDQYHITNQKFPFTFKFE